MHEYLVLAAPSSNRVFAADAPRLCAAEIEDLLVALTGTPVTASAVEIAGVAYINVAAGEPLDAFAMRGLAAVSGVFALFERVGELLRPLAADRIDRYPSDLLSIQKYAGKTNEQWTRLLVNLTVAATTRPHRLLEGSVRLLDPLCGRGTTLNLALTYGFEVTGIDLDKRDFDEYERFLKTWLRQHRFKHSVDITHLRTSGVHRGRRMEVTVAPDKEAFKAGRVQHLSYLNTDTTDLHGVLRANHFDVIVTDTPYGVAHGSHGDRIARNPLALLETAVPGWVRSLRSGGAVGLSYNRHVASPEVIAAILQSSGLEVVGDPDDGRYRHRVDAAIDRDLVLARKPGQPGAPAPASSAG